MNTNLNILKNKFLTIKAKFEWSMVWSEIVSVIGRKISIPTSIIDKI